MKWTEFMENCPPGVPASVENGLVFQGSSTYLPQEELTLYCSSPECERHQFFQRIGGNYSIGSEGIARYECRNCRRTKKVFAIAIIEQISPARLVKIGEYPPFGPHSPSRLISLIGPHRELFLKGRRAESQGLGVGAFAYYRQVVEDQKGRIISEIAKVAKRIGASAETVTVLETAAKETQFSKALDQVKIAIPESLFIDGHNPLQLLHNLSSEIGE